MASGLFPARGVAVVRAAEPVRLLPPDSAAPQNAAVTTSRELADVMRRHDLDTDSGATVTPETAMRTAAVFSCVRVLSEDIAALPLLVYRRLPRGKERVTDHWLPALLEQPNSWQTGYEFREMQQAHVELTGMFFAIKTVVRGEIRELLPVAPWRVRLHFAEWRLRFFVTLPDASGEIEVPADRMYFVRGMSLDGVSGVSPITYLRETVGHAIQSQKYGSRLYRSGAMVGGVLEHPEKLTKEAQERLRSQFDERFSGVDNAYRTLLLEEGMKFTKLGMNAVDAQWIESRKFNRSEIGGIYRVPAHMIGDLEKATFSNIEEQGRDYVQSGLVPRLRRIEARQKITLLSESERRTYFIEHLVEGRLRGSYQVRMAGYTQGVQAGWMTRNEVRELENLNPGPAELDRFLNPAFLTGKGGSSGSSDAADSSSSGA